MAQKCHIVVVTGTRAEFGLLAPVMRAIEKNRRLRLSVVVTGTHLTTGTIRDIQAARFKIAAKVSMQRRGVTDRAADVAALGRGVVGLGKVFARLKPDIVLVLGDRIEAFAAASAASVGGFRVGHIHGGDRAEGVADEAMRHAISKLAHLHFPATALSRKRLIRMGELPEAVFEVGSPAVDALREFNFRASRVTGVALILQHPVGDSDEIESRHMRETIQAVEQFHRKFKLAVSSYILRPNSDPGSVGIIRAIHKRVPLNQYNNGVSPPFFAYRHLWRLDFLALLSSCHVIVGNSSAGLIEAAALGIPCVNIGPRQNGREKPANVIDCGYGRSNVVAAIRKALKLDLRGMKHPYGDGKTGERIARVLATMDFEGVPLRKRNAY